MCSLPRVCGLSAAPRAPPLGHAERRCGGGGPEASVSEFYLNDRPYRRDPLVCGAEMVRCFRNAVRSIRTKLKQVETLSCVLRPPTPEGGGWQRTKTDKFR